MKHKYFPVGDRIPGETMRQFGWVSVEDRMKNACRFRGKATGELRPPRKGEWYLSGAEVTCYQAYSDITTPYYIAKLVVIKTITVEIITEIPSPYENH